MARDNPDFNCVGAKKSGYASLDAILIYVFAPLIGGFLAGVFEEFHNMSITKITNSAIEENDFSQSIAIQ